MFKLIIFTGLFTLLSACGNDKLPKECQRLLEIAERLNLELDTNPYVPSSLADNHKKYLKLTTKGYKKGGSIKGCNTMTEVLEKELKSLKGAKSEEDVKKIILWINGLD